MMPNSRPLCFLSRSALRFLPAAVFLAAGSLFGAVIDLSTGVASWTGSGPNVSGTVAAINLGATPNGVWVPAPSGSQWVSTLGTDGSLTGVTGLPGTYLFSLSFTTPGLGGSLNYVLAADNQGSVVVSLDGVAINTFNHPGNALTDAVSGAQGCAFLPPGSSLCLPAGASQGAVGPGVITWGPGGAGVITIAGTVVNTQPPAPSPIGFLFSGQADVTDVPEAGTSLLMLAGGAALFVSGRRAC